MKYPASTCSASEAHGEILSIAFAGARPAPGRGREDHPRRAADDVEHLRQVDLQGRRARLLPRAARGRRRAPTARVEGRLRRAAPRRGLALRHLSDIRIGEDDVNIGHEATVSKVGEEQLFYLMSRGIPEDEASKLIVNGFIEPIVKELPMEYAVEMNRLIELQMEGSVG